MLMVIDSVPTTAARRFDYILVGAGLQNALIALALCRRRPVSRVLLVEAGDRVGGNHTWCFHEGDLSDGERELVAPLIDARWSGYDVEFPNSSRRLGSAYFAISSQRLAACVHHALKDVPHCQLLLDTPVEALTEHGVRTRDGRTFTAKQVVDARGPSTCSWQPAGYQKFLGLELELATPTARHRPLLMDARVEQIDGFRFLYVLPFAPDRVLIEDTYYSDSPRLDAPSLRERVLDYARENGFRYRRTLREERGVLPLPGRALPVPNTDPLRAGYAGGWFHPTTGYSVPFAAKLACFIAERSPGSVQSREFERFVRRHLRQQRYCLLLNRLLFGAFAPGERRNVLERFYKLPQQTIARFYALEMTVGDRAHIVCGRPPRGMSLKYAFTRSSHA